MTLYRCFAWNERAGRSLAPSMLRRRSLPLALAELELPDARELIDLDDPVSLPIAQRR